MLCPFSLTNLHLHLTYFTAKNSVISPNFKMWKFCGKAQFQYSFGQISRNCAFPQNFHTRKLGEITEFFAVFVPNVSFSYPLKILENLNIKKEHWEQIG